MSTESEQALLKQAGALRDAAAHANRLDIAAKVDEVLTMLNAARDAPAADPRTRTGNTAVRILDGLGF